MPKGESYSSASYLYNLTSALAEILGLFICIQSSRSPDHLDLMKALLTFSIILDCIKFATVALELAVVSFKESWRPLIVGVRWLLYASGGVVAVGSVIMGYLLYSNFESTELADMPWLKDEYSIGVVLYAIAKLVMFEGGLLFTLWEIADAKVWRFGAVVELEERYRYMPVCYYPNMA
eukprot:TRINITY_DN8179_c0_g1_i5.p1 TRINITY_DN8179_c0_g1~~TRINITY_DN8179_c0_g1_i5.p1  ORF type:complete len:178 (+),score=35.20 TRINITY_DN8179_c0_g1_i5:128-661(+)